MDVNINYSELLNSYKRIGLVLCSGVDSIYAFEFIKNMSNQNTNFTILIPGSKKETDLPKNYKNMPNCSGVYAVSKIDSLNFDLFICLGIVRGVEEILSEDVEELRFLKEIPIPKIYIEEGLNENCNLKLEEENLFVLKTDNSPLSTSFSILLFDVLRYFIGKKIGILQDLKIMVTSGGTAEEIDPVRVITNKSSGKMGAAFAEALIEYGADVTYLCSKDSIRSPIGVKKIYFTDVQSLRTHVLKNIKKVNGIVMAAAVSDFQVEEKKKHKIKKTDNGLVLNLKLIDNFIKELPKEVLKIGFAAETNINFEYIIQKMKNRGFDYICLNDVSDNKAFEVDYNQIYLINEHGVMHKTEYDKKYTVAKDVINKLIECKKLTIHVDS